MTAPQGVPAEQCVFKGGTSLSKCYPGSIDRFSEDIDLTFLGMDLSDKECDRTIKRIETVMTSGAETKKIDAERSNRSKSMYVWFDREANKIKLEIGSSVRPDPYSRKPMKTYIHEYLESNGFSEAIEKANYESLHKDLLYTDEKQFFDDALIVLEEIDTILRDIGE